MLMSLQYRSPTKQDFHFAYQDSLTEVRLNLRDIITSEDACFTLNDNN